jgi:hypothetical protein
MHDIKLIIIIIIIIIMKTLSWHGPKRTIVKLKGNNSRLFCHILRVKRLRERDGEAVVIVSADWIGGEGGGLK